MKCICTKTGLLKTLKKFYKNNVEACEAKYTINDSVPTTFLVTTGCEDNEFYNFTQRFGDFASGNFFKEKIPQKHCLNNIWLVKPAAMNQGNLNKAKESKYLKH